MARLRTIFERIMESIVILLMVLLAVEVVVGVTYRKLGMSLSWYDEIAEVTLAWITYYGAALAALKRAHIGFPGLLAALGPGWRVPLVLVGELIVITFFVVLAWSGVMVLDVLATDTLVSLPQVPVSYTQSVIPIGATLFVIAELLMLPQILADARANVHRASAEPEQ